MAWVPVERENREVLAIQNLANLEHSRKRIAALLDCSEAEAEERAVEVRERYQL